MVHQINIFLLLFGALQGWLLSFWFFKNRRKEVSAIYIALLLFTVGLQLTSKVISKGWLMSNTYVFYVLSYQLPYLVGPLLYLYVKARKDKSFSKSHLLHFLPFFVSITLEVISMNSNLLPLRLHPYTEAFFQLVTLFAYTYFSLKISTGATQSFVKIVAVAETIIIITLGVMVVYYGRFPDVRLLFITLTLLIYWISYQVISRSSEFFPAEAPVLSLNPLKSPKYAHSSLKADEADRIEKALQAVMGVEKLYLDCGLTIDALSLKIKTSRHHLSQVINERLGKTYADYISDLRLEEAKKRLSDPANYRYTIAAIAMDSGFSSVSGFNETFKKRFETTPSKFREQALKKMSA